MVFDKSNGEIKENSESPFQLRLSLLGVHILVQCHYEYCLEGIRVHFSPHVTNNIRTPDIIIECDWAEAGRYLFRARPNEEKGNPLTGIRVHNFTAPTLTEWTTIVPPLPPFNLPPLQNRFVGLHAAAVKMAKGQCLIIVGDRNSGKSILSMKLTNESRGQFLTDELVCIHRRTNIVEPFAIAIGLKKDSTANKIPIAANELVNSVASIPAIATHIVFLNPNKLETKESGLSFQPISSDVIFRELLKHHLDIGSTMDESIVTLLSMAESLTAGRLNYSTFEELTQSIPLLLKFVETA